MPSRRIRILVACGLAAVAVVWLWYLLSHQRAPQAAPAPLAVQTMVVTPQAVPEIIETSGTIVSPQSVEVRPQADGVLESVRIRDGQDVHKGDVLFTIDPRPLRAALAQARANLSRDEALAVDAADTERRYKPLAEMQAVDTKSYVTARNTLHSLRAAAVSDRAQVDAAQLSLAYTTVRAPISGRAGAIQVKPGNVVSSASTTPLVILNVASPIEAAFALPHVQVDAVRRAGAARSGESLDVLALDPVSGNQLDAGQLFFLDNAFDDSSGTLGVRARFANAREQLWPGQFVTVRVVLSDGAGALSVPESALQQGQQGPYVYVVDQGRAALRPLTVARLVDGHAVVTKGLRAGDQVILTVPNDLRAGSAVTAAANGGAQAGAVAQRAR